VIPPFAPAQVREAYRKRGWAFINSENIAQCKNDDYLEKIKEQEGEGCNVYGYLEVNKVGNRTHRESLSSSISGKNSLQERKQPDFSRV
jgi:hypothetical protein